MLTKTAKYKRSHIDLTVVRLTDENDPKGHIHYCISIESSLGALDDGYVHIIQLDNVAIIYLLN